jgi:CubicO group peptidase (beta-lactamase class C family)
MGSKLPDVTMHRLSAHLDRATNLALSFERITGSVVIVAVDGDVVYRRAAGMADREGRRAMQENTIFRFASVTKIVVSAAALAMIDRGVFGLDDPITKWLPDFRPALRDGTQPKITVRHLLSHTSGLGYGGVEAQCGKHGESPVSNGLDQPGLQIEDALKRLAAVPLSFEPGTAWKYSLATDVLGALMERACSRPLTEIVKDAVTKPLGLRDTDFVVKDLARLAVPYVDGVPRPNRMMDPHDVSSGQEVLRFSPSRILNDASYQSGGGGMAGTAADLLAILEAIRCGGNPILTRQSVDWLTEDALPSGVIFGELGWSFTLGACVLTNVSIARSPHDRGTWRWGGAYGHDWFVNPLRRLTMVCLTNTAMEGTTGAYPINLRDGIYHALSTTQSDRG